MLENDINFPLGYEQIAAVLPHRKPFLFVTRVCALTESEIVTECDLPEDLSCFKGHFPGAPIFPGVLQVEAAAQAGALLAGLTVDLPEGKFLALAQLDKARFKNPVYPTQVLRVEVKIDKARGALYKFSAILTVDKQTVCELSFTAMLADFKA